MKKETEERERFARGRLIHARKSGKGRKREGRSGRPKVEILTVHL